ncbi:MAG: Endonuclease MutS2 [Dehalococcoidia bacterium]|nr:Endonuclease MutS2 [Chloroflexota bacterium]
MGSIVVGDEVRLIGTNLRGTVLSLRNSQIEMQAGRSKIRLSIEDVEKVKRSPESRGSSQQSVVSSQQSGAGRGTIDYRLSTKSGLPGRTTRLLELDLRGKRAGEIERELDIYLNDASLARLSEARIIHGFGTGTVRQIVREMLASHPLVTSFRPGELGEGGDGVTIVGL